MAKYDVTYSCGHNGTVQLFGKESERATKISWFENSGMCPDCYRAKQEQKIVSANANLPALTGSEKQIAWALRIRAERYQKIMEQALYAAKKIQMAEAKFEAQHDAFVAQYGSEEAAGAAFEKLSTPFRAAMALGEEAEANLASAKWWIENRERGLLA